MLTLRPLLMQIHEIRLNASRKRRHPSLQCMGGATLLLTAALLSASEDADQVRALTKEGRILPLEQLITKARERKAGTLIEAELEWEPEHGVAVYELLMLGDDGELWELEFDARGGELLELEREDD